MEEVRMVSLNVHAWRDRRRRSNTRRVAVLVRDLRPHVLCLQAFEVQARPRWFADDFGKEGEEDPKSTELSLFQSLLALPPEGERAEDWRWEWECMSLTDLEGSAVASRLPVTQRYSHRLSTPEGGQYRPLVGMRVEVEGLGVVEVFSVHLDHRQESRRVAQVESLVAYIDASCGPLRVLLGDFNALSRSDYDDAQWERVCERRREARLDPAATEATDLLRRCGFTAVPHTARDCGRAASDNSTTRPDAQEESDDDDEDQDEVEVHTDGWTCWAGTRVDYAWLSNGQLRVGARLHVVPNLTVSDHRPLLLSLVTTTDGEQESPRHNNP